MTSVPLAIILLPLLIFLILFIIFSVFNLFHIVHYGISSTGKFVIIAIFCAGTVFLLGSGFIVLNGYDWEEPISVDSIVQLPDSSSLFELPEVPLREQEEKDL